MKPLFLNLFGPPGTGKTTVGFTAPPPFFYGRFDRRADKIIEMVRAKFGEASVTEKVFVPELGDTLKALADGYLAGVEELAKAAIQANEGTFFIDGGNRWWDAVQASKLPNLDDPTLTPEKRESLEKMRRLLFGPANEYLSGLQLAVENSDVQMIVTHHTKAVYDNKGQETEMVRPDYFKRTPYTCTMEVFMMTTAKDEVSLPTVKSHALALQGNAKMVAEPPKFYGQITMCKDDANMVGMMLPSPTFPVLYALAMSKPWEGETWKPPFIP